MDMYNSIYHGLPDNANTNGIQHYFSPYAENGGSIVAIAGENYAVIGSDTRLSTGFQIYTREQPKLFQLSNTTVLGSTGCWCDTLTFTKILELRMKMYLHEHQKKMSTPAVAQLVSVMLYYKRFFPYAVSNIVAGLDDDGRGCVYSYDPIGHCEKEDFKTAGSSSGLLQPLLDNQIAGKNMLKFDQTPFPLEKAVAIIQDTFIAAAERDIHTGDGLWINIITKEGIKAEKMDLRKD